LQELKIVFSGKNKAIDTIIPPLLFALVNAYAGLLPATVTALALAAIMTGIRVVRAESPGYAISGLVLTGISAGLAWFTQKAANFFLPSILTGGILLLAALISILVKKPLAALSSHLTRSWPIEWYWLETILPAYTEVTWIWSAFIVARLSILLILYQSGDTTTLGWLNVLLDWPVTVAVLVISYIYGIWRLSTLGGPGVDEYISGKPAPWFGQKRGF
jgi:NADH:ubiquinone oxidoreductase subunit 6 (subunit J)